MLRPVKTVRATTKEEVDAALDTADQITVEGDDELLAYAVNKASSDPENRIRITPGLLALSPQRVDFARESQKPLEEVLKIVRVLSGLSPEKAAEPARLVETHKAVRRTVVIAATAFVALLVIGVAIGWFLSWAPAPPPPPSAEAPRPNEIWTNLPSLLWPLVAIVAIVALFLIAWKAISSGSNVTIQWKVTEKVSGRVVITKVRERAPRQRAASGL
jgi:hypothetical protein